MAFRKVGMASVEGGQLALPQHGHRCLCLAALLPVPPPLPSDHGVLEGLF